MRRTFRTWGLSVLTMVSVATVVLLVTGWGSAVAASVSSVIVTNPASNPVKVHEVGTANVSVQNFPASQAPTTTVIGSGTTSLPGSGAFTTLLDTTDVSAYREVSLYLTYSAPNTADCFVNGFDPSNDFFPLDTVVLDGSFNQADHAIVNTYDPAPPKFQVFCKNTQATDFSVTWMVTGRTD